MRAACVLGVVLVGCSDPLTWHDVSSEEGPPLDEREEVPGSDTGLPKDDALFDLGVVHEIRVELTPEAEAALSSTPLEYTSATIQLGGQRIEDVGIRLKGNKSFRPFSEKPSLKVKFDAFVDDRSYGSLRRLTLNNMVEDPSFAREILTYWLWNDAGMIAPRAAYAELYVNDSYYGLYLLLETMDSAFLERRFADPSGDLWEGEGSSDFTPLGTPFFDLKSGEGDRARLDAIAEALVAPTDDYYASAGEHLQMDQVIDYWAWTMATANLDAYPFTLNDYIVYADPAEDHRISMSPWGMDESWNEAFFFQWGQGVALVGCAADNACFERVEARTEAALQHSESANVEGRLQAFYELSESAIAADTRAPWSSLEVEQARTDLLSFTERWPNQLRSQMGLTRE